MSIRAIADSDLVLRLPCVRVSEDITLENRKLPQLDKKPPAVRKLTSEQQELIAIRRQCGLSQDQFAEALGIGFPRLSSYEHGRTDSIPDWIMQAARSLAETQGASQDAAQQRYANLEMPEILAGWAKRLDVPYDNNRRLAAMLGTTVPTLTRWKNCLTRPRLQSLLFHEQMVEQACAKLSKQAECIGGLKRGRRAKA
ncbi:MAG: helix-turn-helix transcriptional regulator [Hydrogenophilales bacterium]|nr:helix-turn-helix transcriptional regulator [Hydrogenophilales bacterium]